MFWHTTPFYPVLEIFLDAWPSWDSHQSTGHETNKQKMPKRIDKTERKPLEIFQSQEPDKD